MIKAILPFICTSKNAIIGENIKINKAIKITLATKPTYHNTKIIYIIFNTAFIIFTILVPFKNYTKKGK